MIKNFLMKKMLQKQLQGVPKDQQEKLLAMIQENPDLFKKIADEVQQKMKEGKDQMAATTEVMKKHQGTLRNLMEK